MLEDEEDDVVAIPFGGLGTLREKPLQVAL